MISDIILPVLWIIVVTTVLPFHSLFSRAKADQIHYKFPPVRPVLYPELIMVPPNQSMQTYFGVFQTYILPDCAGNIQKNINSITPNNHIMELNPGMGLFNIPLYDLGYHTSIYLAVLAIICIYIVPSIVDGRKTVSRLYIRDSL